MQSLDKLRPSQHDIKMKETPMLKDRSTPTKRKESEEETEEKTKISGPKRSNRGTSKPQLTPNKHNRH